MRRSVFALSLLAVPLLSTAAAEGFDPTGVAIHVEHGIELPWGKPGFSIEVSGWMPEEALSLAAISPEGEKIDLVPPEKPLYADENGLFGVDIDYGRVGLSPGHWVFMLTGKPGAHLFETDLPVVEPPTPANPRWRFTFGEKKKEAQRAPTGPGRSQTDRKGAPDAARPTTPAI